MQAAWLLGALVVPQLLGFGHGVRGPGRDWEGGWGGALEEERKRESLMLKEALGLPIGMGSNDSLAGNSKGEEVLGTKETQGEEEEEETTSPISSSNPFPSPSPTPEDTISYILGRLSGLDAGLHQLHIRLHTLDTRVVQLTQGLRQLRDATSDTHDSVQALKEAQVRAEQEHGRLEGLVKIPKTTGIQSATRQPFGLEYRRDSEARSNCKTKNHAVSLQLKRQKADPPEGMRLMEANPVRKMLGPTTFCT